MVRLAGIEPAAFRSGAERLPYPMLSPDSGDALLNSIRPASMSRCDPKEPTAAGNP